MARSSKNIKSALPDPGEADSHVEPPDAGDEKVMESTTTMATEQDDHDDSPHKNNNQESDRGSSQSSSSSSPLSGSSASMRGDKRKRSVDDAGGSIAEGDEGSTDSPQAPPWQPQNVQSTIEFTHTITDYASKRDSGCKKAEYSSVAVDDHGNRWRLIVYVNGNGRASNHHLSLFLQVADADDLPFGWKKAVSYVLTLEHPGGTTLSYSKRNPDKTFKLCPKAIDWGWSQFITSDRIQQEGFVSNDTLAVRAQVTVKSSSVSIVEEDAELYLKCAVEEGDAEAVKTCLDNGASVNCQFKDDLYTPLHTACSSGTTTGSIEVLQLLLEENADPNASNKWKETPLLIAANNGHRMGVAALLKHGADPSMCSEAGWSALTFAAHKGFDDIVALLLRAGAPVNSCVTEDLSTPLHKACAGSKAGHMASVKLLLEADADVHALNKWRETPLLTAANHGQSTAVEALLTHGADPCKCTDTGWSPLSIAAYKGHDEVVRMLLEEGAPTEEDDPTLSALLQAATKGLPDTVELLLQHGADHTVTTKKGDTALSILVEQNLIDAAVDMVTEYNASIPRCSRDRKKVQRARLLINHRMKQLERVGKSLGSDDDETDGEPDENKEAQHSPVNAEVATETSTAGRKKGKAKGASAEMKAKAAEEALLLELEEEEAHAKKEEAETNKKQAKKKKKKERERQQKLKEEQERREQEEKDKEEQERKQNERLERERKEREERERKLKKQQELEMKEMIEKEKVISAKKKEKEKKERESQRKRDEKSKRELPTNPASPSGSSTSTEARAKNLKSKKPNGAVATASVPSIPATNGLAYQGKKEAAAAPASQGSNRRWENKAAAMPSPAINGKQGKPMMPSVMSRTAPVPSASGVNPPAISTSLAPRPIEYSSGVSQDSDSEPTVVQNGPPISALQGASYAAEHPAIALHRKEKVGELLRRATSVVKVVDHYTVKRAIWRWIVRAAHSDSSHLDPLIPSASDASEMSSFFQRHFISEVRRRAASGFSVNMEQLKEAGATLAVVCQTVAKEMSKLRQQIGEQLPPNWSDKEAGMVYDMQNASPRTVRVAWANRAQVFMPVDAFTSLRDRFTGHPDRFISTVFAAKVWDDTKYTIVDNTGFDVRLAPAAQRSLSVDALVSAELSSDPFTVGAGNVFWSSFGQVDCFFGGQAPFGSRPNSADLLLQQGGSVSVVLPFDSFVASRYMCGMLNAIDGASSRGLPLSFAVFITDESLPDPSKQPSQFDLSFFDPRLGDHQFRYVQRKDILHAGHHFFLSADGSQKVASKDSVLLVLQNDGGRNRFNFSDAVVASISRSMAVSTEGPRTPSLGNSLGFQPEYNSARESPLSSPTPYFDSMIGPRTLDPISPGSHLHVPTDFGAIGGTAISKPFSPAAESLPRGSRRGRLFDLVDDSEDNQSHEVDIVSGMLNNLDMFNSQSVGSDVDIEAISLMGIGGASSLSLPPRNTGSRTFG